MGEEIRNIELYPKTDKIFVVTGKCNAEDGSYYRITLYQNNSKTAAIGKVQSGRMAGMQDVRLERGMYTVKYEKILSMNPQQLDAVQEYPIPVMAGEKYRLEIRKTDAGRHGHRGTLVEINSPEYELGPDTLFYRVLLAGDLLGQIKFPVPEGDGHSIAFFVADVPSESVLVGVAFEGLFDIVRR